MWMQRLPPRSCQMHGTIQREVMSPSWRLESQPTVSSSRPPRLLRRGLGQTSAMSSGTANTAPASSVKKEEVSIRRYPPYGIENQACGPYFDFQVDQPEENKPRNILEEIVWYKAIEIGKWRDRVPIGSLVQLASVAPPPRDFIGALRAKSAANGRPGLIAEVKKASPSRGVIQPDFDPVRIARAYEAGGAACLSVLTDSKYFQGSFENLTLIRAAGVQCPLLCKEFIVEAYQIFKARAAGADAVLLIAAVLPNADLKLLIKTVARTKMQVLLEVHSVEELERVLRLDLTGVMLGINNRDLTTFKVDLGNTRDIMASAAGRQVIEREILMAGESAIFEPADVAFVAEAGCGAVLVGESLVKQGDPAEGCRQLLA